jgi:hypothetical protein
MRSKQLLPLAIILVALVAAVVLLKRPTTPTKLADEVGFERIFPASLTADAIQGIDLYQGDKKDHTVQLRRQGDTWVAASYYNAPVKADKVRKLLDGVSKLEGDVRADKADMLDTFKLKDTQALHVLFYTDQPDKPTAHLLAGKSSGRSGFVRRAEQNRVYSVNLNLRTEAGLYGNETDKVPEAKPWLNLQLHDIPKDQVTGVELQSPGRRLQLALKKPKPEKSAEHAKSADGEAKSKDEPDTSAAAPKAKAAAPKAKPEWELIEPKVNYPLKQGVVEGMVTTLRTLRGDDVVAPDKMAEYGLDSPPYRAVLTVEEEGKEARQVTIAVGNTVSKEDEKRYVRLEQDDSPVYLLPKWSFHQVFPTLGTILTLDVLNLTPDDIVRVGWEQAGQSLALERQPAAEANAAASSGKETSAEPAAKDVASGEATPAEPAAKKGVWRWVQAPEVDVDADKLKALLDTVERLTADDWFADTPAKAGLDQPVLALSLTLRNGATHHVMFGQTRGKDQDRYVSLQGKEGTFVIAKASYTSIANALKALRPEAPAPAAAPASETMPKPVMAVPKPETSSAEPAEAPAAEGTTITRPMPGAAPETPAVINMPTETRPTPLSAPNPTSVGSSATSPTEETPATPATDTKSTPPAKPEEK